MKRVQEEQGQPRHRRDDGGGTARLICELHWPRLREQLLAGRYQPQPVRRLLIPKSGGGERELGIPTVLDRFIQQALLAGPATAIRPDLLGAQLRLPAGTPRARCCARGASVRPGRSPLGGGRGSGEVLRSRQPRRADGKAGEADRGPPRAWAHPPLSRSRHHGERGGGGAARGNAARRSPVAAAWRTCSSTKSTRSWRSADTRSCATPTTATSTCGRRRAGERVMEALRRLYARLRLRINEAKSAVARAHGTASSSATRSGSLQDGKSSGASQPKPGSE